VRILKKEFMLKEQQKSLYQVLLMLYK